MVIGLTGKYCAGKNAAAAVFEEKGIPVIDVDKLGHLALEANTKLIRQAFGDGVMHKQADAGCPDSGAAVDRKALGALVFSDPEALEKLESINHPWMKEETARLVKQYTAEGAPHVVINAAILYKMKLDLLCDTVIWITAPLFTRIGRALRRDSAGIISVIKRIYAQRQLNPKQSRNSVDIYRVGNGAGTDRLKSNINAVLENIEQKGRDGR